MTQMRKGISAQMTRALAVPHAYVSMEVDATNLVRLRESAKRDFQAREGLSLSYVPFVVKASVEALRRHAEFNAHWTDAGLLAKRRVNVGVAVAVDDGLIVPVIRDVDALSIAGLNRAIADVAARARAGKLRLDDFGGGTFTIDNTGWLGSNLTMPIINVPEVAILTMEAITKRAVVVEIADRRFDRDPPGDEHGPRDRSSGQRRRRRRRLPADGQGLAGGGRTRDRHLLTGAWRRGSLGRCASSSPAAPGSSVRRSSAALRARGDDVIAAVRDPDRARALGELGCRLVRTRPVLDRRADRVHGRLRLRSSMPRARTGSGSGGRASGDGGRQRRRDGPDARRGDRGRRSPDRLRLDGRTSSATPTARSSTRPIGATVGTGS